MPRKSQREEDATLTDDYKSTQKKKYMTPSNMRLASHNKTRVAYFHDEGVGNYHYGVSIQSLFFFKHIYDQVGSNAVLLLFSSVSLDLFVGKASHETASFDIDQSPGSQLWAAQENGDLPTSKGDR
jgi:hypothetical protein